jgi:hypothetical protein
MPKQGDYETRGCYLPTYSRSGSSLGVRHEAGKRASPLTIRESEGLNPVPWDGVLRACIDLNGQGDALDRGAVSITGTLGKARDQCRSLRT